jgi:hypothetical protein
LGDEDGTTGLTSIAVGKTRKRMKYAAALALTVGLAACSSQSPNSSKLTLKNTVWDHVNVQIVITTGADCDARGPEFVSSQNFVLRKDQTKLIVAPNGASVCWRKDRYPNNPQPDSWSNWSRAVLFPDTEISSEV